MGINNIKSKYLKFRVAGYTADQSLRNAKILRDWQKLEVVGLVRLYAKEECENYFDVFGRECLSKEDDRRTEELIERFGVSYVVSEYKCPCCGEWSHADSIGMNIYEDPTDPMQNCYVPDLMISAIDELNKKRSDS